MASPDDIVMSNASHVGIIYGLGDNRVHGLLIPDRDEELSDPVYVKPGIEAMVLAPMMLYRLLPFQELAAWYGLKT